jgi:glucose-6-phosphate 1-dehydrogenase
MSHSDASVFFGATEDLRTNRSFEALQALVKRHTLDLPIIGVAKWKIVGPALEDVTLIYEYAPNTWASRSMMDPVRGWVDTKSSSALR